MSVEEYVENRKRQIDHGGLHFASGADRKDLLRLRAEVDSFWKTADATTRKECDEAYFAMVRPLLVNAKP